MPYIISASEKFNEKCSDSETKALLYLYALRKDSQDINWFVIDFFNDLTGVDALNEVTWDVQSKAAKNVAGKEIGRELVTLFKNYISDFDFTHYILFAGSVSVSSLIDSDETVFSISNFTAKAVKSIKSGLIEEANKKTYILDKSRINAIEIEAFLDRVTFVIAENEKSSYIKKAVKDGANIITDDSFFDYIFNEIRDAQSSKKLRNYEGESLNAIADFQRYNKHLESTDIKLLLINRLLGLTLPYNSVPFEFIPYVGIGYEGKLKAEKCSDNLMRCYYDKNNSDAFWKFLDDIVEEIIRNPSHNIDQIYDLLNKDIVKKLNNIDSLTVKFFIAIIKESKLV